MHVSPVLAEVGVYPFARVDAARRRAVEAGATVTDFGLGDPQEPVEPFIRDALIDGLSRSSGYPRAAGLAELRVAIAGWLLRRFGVEIDPDQEVIPTLGSKEAIFTFSHLFVDPAAHKDIVVTTEPGYPVAERGARFAGAHVIRLPLERETGFLPDLDAIAEDVWDRVAVAWVNYPNNPTGALAPLGLYERLAHLAERHDFVVASDEAYSELYFGAQPVSALQVPAWHRIAVFNSLSKRSSMTAYRSGFVVAGDTIARALRVYRTMTGTAPQEFVQRAAIAAWQDEAHVERTRGRYRRKRDLLMPVLESGGLAVVGGDATMFLWAAVPEGETSEEFALRMLSAGIVVTPGSALGRSGERFVRLALVPTEADCMRAAATLEEVL